MAHAITSTVSEEHMLVDGHAMRHNHNPSNVVGRFDVISSNAVSSVYRLSSAYVFSVKSRDGQVGMHCLVMLNSSTMSPKCHQVSVLLGLLRMLMSTLH